MFGVFLLLGGPLWAAPFFQLDTNVEPTLLPTQALEDVWVNIKLSIPQDSVYLERPPVNLVLLIDESEGLLSEHYDSVRRLVSNLLSQLDSNDVLSIVTYGTTVSLPLPASYYGRPKKLLKRLTPRPSSKEGALFSALIKGAGEMRKFMAPQRVNHMVVLSEGPTHLGPSKVGQFSELAQMLRREGMLISTVGIGWYYQEDLLTALAHMGGGVHVAIPDFADMEFQTAALFAALVQPKMPLASVLLTPPSQVNIKDIFPFATAREGDNFRIFLPPVWPSTGLDILLKMGVETFAPSTFSALELSLEYRLRGKKESQYLDFTLAADAGLSEPKAKNEPALLNLQLQKKIHERTKRAIRARDEGNLILAQELLQQNALELDRASSLFQEPGQWEDIELFEKGARYMGTSEWRKIRKILLTHQERQYLKQLP